MSATIHGAPAPHADASRQDFLKLRAIAGTAQATGRLLDTGFLPCHDSRHDTRGRMRRGPAPLSPPRDTYETDSKTKHG